MNADDTRLLRIAYEEAKAGFDEGGCPIGSVLARGGEVVAQGRNQRVQKGWRAPIGWSGLIVSASWASGPSGRCFGAQAGDTPRHCAA